MDILVGTAQFNVGTTRMEPDVPRNVDIVLMEISVTMSMGLVSMGVSLGIIQLCVIKNVLLGHTEKTVCKTAVKNVPPPGNVTEGPVHVMVVVKRAGNLLCVMQNVMTSVMEEIAANRAVTVKMECLVTRKLDGVPRGGVHLGLKKSTATKHVTINTTDLTAT